MKKGRTGIRISYTRFVSFIYLFYEDDNKYK